MATLMYATAELWDEPTVAELVAAWRVLVEELQAQGRDFDDIMQRGRFMAYTNPEGQPSVVLSVPL